jgi:type II secretory pathway pseudopilin PulG
MQTGLSNGHVFEEGIGLIEVIIAMFLLAILAVALLPAVAGMVNVSAKNSLLATANQGVNQMLERARSVGNTCAALNPLATAPQPLPRSSIITTDSGARIEVDLAVVCNSAAASRTAPGIATVTAYAYQVATPHKLLASGQTSIVVTG